MATIGTFTKADNGNFTGTIKTATLNLKTTIRPVDSDNDKAPDYRVTVGAFEFGAAWKQTSRNERPYLSVKLDDPTFPVPIYAMLVETETVGEYGPPSTSFRRMSSEAVCRAAGAMPRAISAARRPARSTASTRT